MSFSDNSTKSAPSGQKTPESRYGGTVRNNSVNALREMGTSMFDQLLGNYPKETHKTPEQHKKFEAPKPKHKPEIKTVFTFQQEQDKHQMKELMHQIKQEIKMLQKADKSLMQEVKDIEKITLSSNESSVGVYHVRFMEVVLHVLQMLRAKVNESRTWMHTMAGRGRKRGSMGKHSSQYAQELSANSVQ